MSSSIHIQKASGGSVHHNSRENFSHSVVFTDEKNEVWNNAKDSFTIYRDELKIRSEAYSNSTGQKLQSRAVTQLSAVLNLEQHHTMKDLEPIKKYLEKEFDTKVFQMAIHRDEGKLKEKATGNYLVSGTDFFLNPKDNKHYYDKKYTKPLNLDNYTIEKNYHAHIEMMGLKSNGKAIRQDMNKFKLSKLQDFVAESLQMERGKNYRIEKSSKRLDTHEFKKAKKIENNVLKSATAKEQAKSNATIQELKEANAELKAELQTEKAKRPEHAQREQLLKDLEIRIKNKDLTIQEMNAKFEELKNKLLKEKNEALESVKSTIISHEEEKTAYEQSIENFKKELMQKDDLIFGFKTNYGKLEKEKDDLKTLNEMKPKEVEKIVEVKVENPINTQLQVDISDYRRMLKETTDTKNQQINTLQEENEELKNKNKTLNSKIVKAINLISEALNIPRDLNFTFFDSVVDVFKSLQAQIRDLTAKDTTSSTKTTPEAPRDDLSKFLNQYDESVSQKHSEEDIEKAMKEFKRRRDDYK